MGCNKKQALNIKNNYGFANLQLIEAINKRINENKCDQVVTLFIFKRNDSTLISISSSKFFSFASVRRKNESLADYINSYDFPYYKFKNKYIVFAYGSKSDNLGLKVINKDSLMHNPRELYELLPKAGEEISRGASSPRYDLYFINNDSIIYLGKKYGW